MVLSMPKICRCGCGFDVCLDLDAQIVSAEPYLTNPYVTQHRLPPLHNHVAHIRNGPKHVRCSSWPKHRSLACLRWLGWAANSLSSYIPSSPIDELENLHPHLAHSPTTGATHSPSIGIRVQSISHDTEQVLTPARDSKRPRRYTRPVVMLPWQRFRSVLFSRLSGDMSTAAGTICDALIGIEARLWNLYLRRPHRFSHWHFLQAPQALPTAPRAAFTAAKHPSDPPSPNGLRWTLASLATDSLGNGRRTSCEAGHFVDVLSQSFGPQNLGVRRQNRNPITSLQLEPSAGRGVWQHLRHGTDAAISFSWLARDGGQGDSGADQHFP